MSFPPRLVEPLAESGHLVVAIDPRDTGGSTRYDGPPIDLGAILAGDLAVAPYTYNDMATDALGVLDALDVESAVWIGHSMGGGGVAAVQAMAPDRVDGLVYFSCSPGFGEGPSPEFLDLVLRDEPGDSDTAIAWAVDVSRWSLGRQFDEATAPADAACRWP